MNLRRRILISRFIGRLQSDSHLLPPSRNKIKAEIKANQPQDTNLQTATFPSSTNPRQKVTRVRAGSSTNTNSCTSSRKPSNRARTQNGTSSSRPTPTSSGARSPSSFHASTLPSHCIWGPRYRWATRRLRTAGPGTC